MIRSFKDKATAEVARGRQPKRLSSALFRSAQRKLFLLENAVQLNDLATPPGNRLEALQGNRAGQYSNRINDQFRICFTWTGNGPENVEIVDYH
jgi:toxin HigB-1